MKYINIFFSYLFFPLNITTEYIQKLGYYLRDQKNWSHKKMFIVSFSMALTSLGLNLLIHRDNYLLFMLFSALWVYHKSRKEDYYKRSQGIEVYLVFAKVLILMSFMILFMILSLGVFTFLLFYFFYVLFFSFSTLVFTLKKDPPKNKHKEEKVTWFEKLKKMMGSFTPAPKGA